MKVLFVLSLLCINNIAPPDSLSTTDKKKQPVQQKPQQKPQPAPKPAPKKVTRTPVPFYPSPLLVDLF